MVIFANRVKLIFQSTSTSRKCADAAEFAKLFRFARNSPKRIFRFVHFPSFASLRDNFALGTSDEAHKSLLYFKKQEIPPQIQKLVGKLAEIENSRFKRRKYCDTSNRTAINSHLYIKNCL